MNSFHKCLVSATLFLSLLSCQAQFGYGQSRTDAISMTGDSSPHGNGSISSFFRSSNEPLQLNNSGSVAFTANLSGTANGTVDDLAIFLGNGNTIQTVVVEGQNSPSGNGIISSTFFGGAGSLVPRNGFLNDSGEMVISSRYSDTLSGTSDSRGLLSFKNGILDEVARSGQTPPGSLFPFSGNGDFAATINNNGLIGFHANTTDGTTSTSGLYLNSTTGLQTVAKSGDSVPNTLAGPNGGTFSSFSDFTLNDTGNVAFTGLISNSPSDVGIFIGDEDGIRGVARIGTPNQDGQLILSISSGAINNGLEMKFNNADQVAFHGLAGGRSTVLVGDGHSLAQVAAQQNQMLGNLGLVKNIHEFEFNDSGQVAVALAFDGDFDNNLTDSIVRRSGEEIIRLANVGDTLNNVEVTGLDRSIHFNNSGALAFSANLNSNNGDQGFFVTDGIETLKAVQIGDSLAGSTVSQLRSIRNAAFNEHGQLAFHATLSNGQETISRWTPEMHFRNTSGGAWDDSTNWTLSLTPDQVHDVFINSDSNVTISGPDGIRNVRSLQVGNGLGQSTLQLQANSQINAGSGIQISGNGTVNGNGILNGNIVNAGLLSGSLTINGNVSESGSGHISVVNENFIINGNLNAFNPISMTGGQVTINGDAVFNNSLASASSGTLVLNGKINGTSDIVTQQSQFATSLVLGDNAESVFQFDENGFDSWLVSGQLQRNGVLTIESDGGFAGLDFNESFQITHSLGPTSGQFDGLSEGALVGNFDGVDLFVSYQGGNGDDTILTTELVPQWVGGAGNWNDTSNWINGLPTINSKAVLLDKDPNVDSVVTTLGQTPTIQRLRIDQGDTLIVERNGNSFNDGNLLFDLPSSSGLAAAVLQNNGSVQIDASDQISFQSDLEISGTGTIHLQGANAGLNQLGINRRLVNGASHSIDGVGQIQARNIDNFGVIEANVATSSLTNLTVSGQPTSAGSSSFTDGVLNNHGLLRASNGGGLFVNTLETNGGAFEATGAGSLVLFRANRNSLLPATRINNVTFRTSDGGQINIAGSSKDVALVENLTNEGFLLSRHFRLFDSMHNTGFVQLINSFDENLSLGNNTSITGNGNGTLDFIQGGNAFIGEFDLSVESNNISGLGTFKTASTLLKDTVLNPNRRLSSLRPDVGVFEFLSETVIDSSVLKLDIYGDHVAPNQNTNLRAPDSSIANVFRDLSFPENGIDSTNMEYDQLNFYGTLTMEDDIELDLRFLDGFTPEDGQFFDVLTADQLILNGQLVLNSPIIDGKTFGFDILNLPDPGAGFNRDVLRLTWGAASVPEPSTTFILCFTFMATMMRRTRGRCLPN